MRGSTIDSGDRQELDYVRRQQNYRELAIGLARLRSSLSDNAASLERGESCDYGSMPYWAPTVWDSIRALNVHTRCTVINYLNGAYGAYQARPPSQLPHDYYEYFSPVGFVDHWFWKNSCWHKYAQYFDKILAKQNIARNPVDVSAAARAQMRRWGWYEYPAFIQFIKRLPEYEDYVLEIDAQLRYDPEFLQRVQCASPQAVVHITQAAHDIQNKRRIVQQEREAERARQERQVHYNEVQAIYPQDREIIKTHLNDDQFIRQLSREVGCDIELRHTRRQKALDAVSGNDIAYIDQSYALSPQAQQLLRAGGFLIHGYTNCYGNRLQHVIHEEIIEIAELTAQLTSTHLAHPYRHALMDYIEAARIYNQEGLVGKAMTITDLCYSLLGYGVAVIRGAGQGVLDAAIDIVQNPVPVAITVGSMAFGAPVSTAIGGAIVLYYTTKLGVAVIDVGSAYVRDKERGRQKFDDYIAPLQEVIGIFADQEIETNTKVQLGSRMASRIIAQQILFKGIRKTVTAASVRAISFVANSPGSAVPRYTATPNGSLITASSETNNLVGGHDLVKCPASCAQMHENLKSALKIEEFTSVIKATQHGIQRLIERGFVPEEVKILLNNPDITRIQRDGATVFIKFLGNNKYNCMIYNNVEEKVITALRMVEEKALIKLGNNHGWSL